MMAESISFRGSLTQATLKEAQKIVDGWSAHPFMVQLARAICSAARAKTPIQEDSAIHAFVRDRVEYRGDPVMAEWVQDPFETMIVSRAGDCDDMAVSVATLLQAIGHPCRVAAIEWAGRGVYSHCVAIDKKTNKVVDAIAPNLEPWPSHSVKVQAILEA